LAKITFFKKNASQFKKHFYLCSRKCNRGVVQLASILAWGASGRPFESGRSDDQKDIIGLVSFIFLYFYLGFKTVFP